jgi:hypothetical protein
MRISMSNNKSLTSLDLRRNPGCAEGIYLVLVLMCLIYLFSSSLAAKAILEIEKCVHQNEHHAKSGMH